jgi:hypothetical protein
MNGTPDPHPESGGDELIARYREAVQMEGIGPGSPLRAAVLAQARALARQRSREQEDAQNHATAAVDAPENMVQNIRQTSAVSGLPSESTSQPSRPRAGAANDKRWLISAVASVAVLGFVGLLALQFDRGNQAERDLALGKTTAPAPVAIPAPVPAPAAEPAPASVQEAHAASSQISAPRPAPPARPRAPAAMPAPPPAPAPVAQDAMQNEAAISTRQSAARDEYPLHRSPESAVRKTQTAPAEMATATVPATAPAPALAAAPPPPPAPTQAPDRQDWAVSAAEARSQSKAEQVLEYTPTAPVAAGAASATTVAPVAAPPAAARSRTQAAPEAAQTSAAPADRAAPPVPSPQQRLWAAVESGQIDAARAVLAQGTSPNAADDEGRTALIRAARRGDEAMARLLIKAGADTRRVDRAGLTAADHARRTGHKALARVIESSVAR